MIKKVSMPAKQKFGSPSWKDRHPKLHAATKRVGPKAYIIGSGFYIAHGGRKNTNMLGVGIRAATVTAPAVGYGAYKKSKARKGKRS